MYLTRAFLDPKSRDVRADVRNPESLHKTVMRAFPDDSGPAPRRANAVLYRLDEDRRDRLVLLLQSRIKPIFERWPTGYVLAVGSDLDFSFSNIGENPATRSLDAQRAAISVGARFAFRLRANTTKKIDTKTGPDGVHRNGRRVLVRGDEERQRWLARHAEAAGFAVEGRDVQITEIAARGGRGGKSVTVGGALFEGILVVRHVERFVDALESGIGPAKAYGFGLLSIARVP